jgi:hypothetical protein
LDELAIKTKESVMGRRKADSAELDPSRDVPWPGPTGSFREDLPTERCYGSVTPTGRLRELQRRAATLAAMLESMIGRWTARPTT